MARTGGGTRDGVGVSLGAVAAGSMVANVCSYAIHLSATRWWLDTAEYGELAVGLSAMLVLGVVALAIQAVVARSVVHHVDPARIRLVTGQTTALVAVLAVVGTPFAAWATSLGVGTALAALLGAVPLVLVGAGQGILQGRSAFRLLGWVLAVVGVLRTVPVVVVLAVGFGPLAALLAGAVGTLAAACVVGAAVRIAPPHPGGAGPQHSGGAGPPHPGGVGAKHSGALWMVDVFRASGVQLVLIVAVSVDVLLSRTALTAGDAGIYALGAVVTKVAFWLPQAIGVVFYPRLSDPLTSGPALRRAVIVVAGIGAVVTVGAGAAGPLVPMVIGDGYRELMPILWVFAWTGSALAVLQVALLSAIARDHTRVAVGTWVVLGIEIVVILTCVHSVVALAAVAATAATIAAAGTCWYIMHRQIGGASSGRVATERWRVRGSRCTGARRPPLR